MADYNVNMKQWNGTSFDNVLPLAYNALSLNGQTLQDIKNGEIQIIRGSYIGTGTYGASNPNTLTFPFIPQIFIVDNYAIIYHRPISKFTFWQGTNSYTTNITWGEGNSISWYGTNLGGQNNASGKIYYWTAIGKINDVIDDTTSFLITSSGSFTVPKTGNYYMELYGGGGGSRATSSSSGYTGGTSCQSYSSIALSAGDVINVVIGTGGEHGGVSWDASSGTPTSFGSYSVAGGGAATNRAGGSAAGNLGTSGAYYSNSQYYNSNKGTFPEYGSCSSSGTNGAVYLKYLGA